MDLHLSTFFSLKKFKSISKPIRTNGQKQANKNFNIAVVGKAGCGKSTLINSLRGMYPSNEGAAKIGIVEPTLELTAYVHPENENIVLWDFPGFNLSFSTSKTPKKYMGETQSKSKIR